MLGLQGSSEPGGTGSRSGPNQGRANGNGSTFNEESTTFKRERIRTSKLDPRGMVVGKLDIKGLSPLGEAKFEGGATIGEVVHKLAEDVETEPLPIEHRESLRRYHESLRGGVADSPYPERSAADGVGSSAADSNDVGSESDNR